MSFDCAVLSYHGINFDSTYFVVVFFDCEDVQCEVCQLDLIMYSTYIFFFVAFQGFSLVVFNSPTILRNKSHSAFFLFHFYLPYIFHVRQIVIYWLETFSIFIVPGTEAYAIFCCSCVYVSSSFVKTKCVKMYLFFHSEL